MSSSSLRRLLRRSSHAGGVVAERLREFEGFQLLAAVIAVLSGVAVFLLATIVFPYHSSNHDEAVYLMQAAMLLEGQLELYAGEVAGAFRPWFFVEDGGRLYPKYTPVPAAMYAVSMALFGEPQVTLAAVAAGNVALVYLLGTTVFDRRVGVVAAALFAASPLALTTTSVFLPYAPTTLLNLTFAVAYLRGLQEKSLTVACVAGIAIGLAFFARPYTAVLFAAPFVVHATYRVGKSLRERGLRPVPDPVRHHGTTAVFGLLFVVVTLAYNYRMTGSPLLFPYEAFAPLDGPGFGRRRILGHSIEYTPEVALRSNGYVLWYFATRWFIAGPVGTILAAGGLGLAVRRWLRGERIGRATADGTDQFALERTSGALLGMLFVTVPVGNFFFWGSHNILGTPDDPTDGIIAQFGPFYHFDLLVPLSLFAAVAVVTGWQYVPTIRSHLEERLSVRTTAIAVVSVLVAIVLAVGLANAIVISAPLDRSASYTDKYEQAYEPIDDEQFDGALVFLPTPYGDWQNHPFQYLRNDPGFDGRVVYALDRGPGDDFAVIDAYPDRTYYRYTYRGEWSPNPDRHVVPKLEPIAVRHGATLHTETEVGVPDRVEHARVVLENSEGTRNEYRVDNPDGSLQVPWLLDSTSAQLIETESDDAIGLDETDTVVLTVTLVQSDGSTLTYRQEATVRTDTDGVEVIWPPERYVCPLVTDCGNEGTYLTDDPAGYIDGVSFETRIVETTTSTNARRSPAMKPNRNASSKQTPNQTPYRTNYDNERN